MTIPRDAIGLSERLPYRIYVERDPETTKKRWYSIKGMGEEYVPATQLDALSARVKELEALCRYLIARATRAEQERDEAVTSTRYKIFDNLLGAYIGAVDEHIRVAIGNLAYMIFPEHREVLREAAEDRRLAAGPEKEKRE